MFHFCAKSVFPNSKSRRHVARNRIHRWWYIKMCRAPRWSDKIPLQLEQSQSRSQVLSSSRPLAREKGAGRGENAGNEVGAEYNQEPLQDDWILWFLTSNIVCTCTCALHDCFTFPRWCTRDQVSLGQVSFRFNAAENAESHYLRKLCVSYYSAKW